VEPDSSYLMVLSTTSHRIPCTGTGTYDSSKYIRTSNANLNLDLMTVLLVF